MDPAEAPPLARNPEFQRLFWAHVISLLGSGLSAIAIGLLAHELVGASASVVLGMTLTIRIGVIVFLSPWAGLVAERIGLRRTLVMSDLFRAGIVVGLLFADSVWQIYVLAFFLYAGSAVFTPVYKAVIPGVVTDKDYPRALAWGTVAYDTANILGPVLAAAVIALVGFRGSFALDAVTFVVSALLLFGLPRLDAEAAKPGGLRVRSHALHGVQSMFRRWPLRRTLLLAMQVSVTGGFVLVATVEFIKVERALPDAAYAWVMAAYGLGSVSGALLYGHSSDRRRHWLCRLAAPGMLGALVAAGFAPGAGWLALGWLVAGAGQSVLGIRGNEWLAQNSLGEERPHIYAAHFSLSHAGWGVSYPLAGWLTAGLGFSTAALVFAGFLVVISVPQMIEETRFVVMHWGRPDWRHEHAHESTEGSAALHRHIHRHGDTVHSHPHLHNLI